MGGKNGSTQKTQQGRIVNCAWAADVSECSTVPAYSHLFSIGAALGRKPAQRV